MLQTLPKLDGPYAKLDEEPLRAILSVLQLFCVEEAELLAEEKEKEVARAQREAEALKRRGHGSSESGSRRGRSKVSHLSDRCKGSGSRGLNLLSIV